MKPRTRLMTLPGWLLLALLITGCFGGSSSVKEEPDDVDPDDSTPAVKQGETVERKDLPPKVVKKADPPVKDPETLKESLQKGKTYRVIQKTTLTAQGKDRDWGKPEVVKVGMYVEQAYTRTIEENDGKKLVELREYETHRFVKVLTGASELKIIQPNPEGMLLDSITSFVKGKLVPLTPADTVLDLITVSKAAALKKHGEIKVLGGLAQLAGKKIRLTSVDGQGVISVEPIGCTLNAWERDHLMNKSLSSHAHLVTSFSQIKVGGISRIPGFIFGELISMIDTKYAPRVGGNMVVKRSPDIEEGGKKLSLFDIQSESELKVMDSDESTDSTFIYKPTGTLKYVMADRYLRSGKLGGDLEIKTVPRGPMSKTTFREKPELTFTYFAEMK